MIIDTHFHAFPGKFLDLLPEAKNDVRGVGFHAFDHQEYLQVMDKHGIDIGVLSNTGGRIEKAGRARALELCRVLNDAFAEAHAKYPRRFLAFARLPMIDMDDCDSIYESVPIVQAVQIVQNVGWLWRSMTARVST